LFDFVTVIVKDVSVEPGSDVSVPINFTFAGLHFWALGPFDLPCPGSAVALEAARAAVASATVTSLGRRIRYLQGSRSLPRSSARIVRSGTGNPRTREFLLQRLYARGCLSLSVILRTRLGTSDHQVVSNGGPEQTISREEVVATMFILADIAEEARVIRRLLEEFGGEEEQEGAD
jgi:hypothetical protein